MGRPFPQIESDTDTGRQVGRQVGRQAGRREPSPEPDDRYQNQITTALEPDDDRLNNQPVNTTNNSID